MYISACSDTSRHEHHSVFVPYSMSHKDRAGWCLYRLVSLNGKHSIRRSTRVSKKLQTHHFALKPADVQPDPPTKTAAASRTASASFFLFLSFSPSISFSFSVVAPLCSCQLRQIWNQKYRFRLVKTIRRSKRIKIQGFDCIFFASWYNRRRYSPFIFKMLQLFMIMMHTKFRNSSLSLTLSHAHIYTRTTNSEISKTTRGVTPAALNLASKTVWSLVRRT